MRHLRDLLSKKKLLIFDFDGTLVDTSPYHQEAFSLILSKKKIDFNYDDIAGMNSISAFKKVFKDNNFSISSQDLSMLVSEKQSLARSLISKNLIINSNVTFFLEWMYHSANLKSCIVSSGSSETINIALNKFSIGHYFDFILASEDVIESKPSPEGFLKAVEIAGIEPEDAIIFEDSEAGLIAARNAKIDFLEVDKMFWEKLASIIQ